MPYGVDKDLGGDNKTNDNWMEKGVTKLTGKGKDKESAIRICKYTLKNTKKSVAEFILDKDIIEEYNNLINDK